MKPSATSKRDFEKIGSAIFLYVQELGSRVQNLSEHRALLIGPLPESAEEAFLAGWQNLSSRPICTRAFRSTAELENWRQRFERAAVGIDPVLLPSDRDVQLPVGAFDLIALLEGDPKISSNTLTGLKRLLKRNGTLILASKTEMTQRLKVWLVAAGFQGIAARSDGQSRTSDPIEIDGLIARSDGRVSATAAVDIRSGETESIAVPLPEKQIPTPSPIVPLRTAEQTLSRPGALPNREAVRQLIISLVEQMLQLPPGVLDTSSPFTEFGIDSIGSVILVNELNRQLKLELKPTILFDYASVEKLTTYISDQCRPGSSETSEEGEAKITEREEQGLAAAQERGPTGLVAKSVAPIASGVRETDIAVIGISGRFPGAENVQQFWENLLAGRNSISEAPSDRWDYRGAAQPNSLRPTSTKRGGFLSDAAEFDPLFFNISGREAEVTDPQHRLFLEESYHALEDAGYAGPSAQLAKKCGVFVGVEPGDYLHVLMESGDRNQNAPVFQGNAESILAARIAYFLDLKGPSIAINTACSSSLVAIHLACQSLINGECDLALAGGVRVFASEKAYVALGNMGMLSPDGQCKTFDERADGFVPGEAVGVLVLKPLSVALRDGDHIDGVIKGSAINQDGRTNGITAPSSLSQTQVELEVYEKFSLKPETFQYVEAHGTGTKLGDPIEIEALTAAFKKSTSNKSFCGIGSVKTNIGHTMAAAGVCSVIKVLLSLRHSKIPPSLNLQKVNPYIDFAGSPFFVNVAVQDWPAVSGQPRRAAISSFGFSGTNSHLVLEEAPRKETPKREALKLAYLVALSAKSEEALQRQLKQLCDWLGEQESSTDLEQISFTLNVGRGHFEHRCACVVSSIGELHDALKRTVSGELTNNIWRSPGNRSDQSDAAVFGTLAEALLKETISQKGGPNYREKLSALAALYVKGHDFDGKLLHAGERHQRISLPTYPFARERYWIAPVVKGDASEDGLGRARQERLHPLVHLNNSASDRNEFLSSFEGSEFFLNEHRIRGVKILPGVAYLEMAIAATRRLTNESRLSLKNVAWLRPLDCDKAKRVAIRLSRDGHEVRFGIWSGDGDILHAEGRAICGVNLPERREDLSLIRARCAHTESSDLIYARCAEAGLALGPAFRTIQEIWVGQNEALARLEVPARITPAAVEFCLHPGLLDGALQTIAVLGRGQGLGLPVPFALREVRFGELGANCYAHVRRGVEENGLLRFDIDLLNDLGQVLVELNGLAMRALAVESSAEHDEPIYVRPTWRKTPLGAIPTQLSGRLLLFDSDEEMANEISRVYPGLDVVPVIPGAFFQPLEVGFRVQPDSIQDFEKLLQIRPPDFVIYRWATSCGDTSEALDRCILPLFSFVRTLLLQGINSPIQLLVPYQSVENPAYAALAGYARTLQQERPNIRLKVVESVVAGASQLICELRDQARDTEVRYVDGERQVRGLELLLPESLAELPLRERGVYLIAGGLGGLGRIFARYLAKAYQARLILLGRSEATAEQTTFLNELESLGAKPLYLGADVAVRQDLETALAKGRSRFGEIHGVIHAAGVIRDGFILNKEDFASVIRPKVFGAIALDELTTKDPLDFFVLFSSIAGVFGNVGQSDYAYANRFLDEFAHLRERRRRRSECAGVTVSIGWPAWRNGGMHSNEELELRKLSQVGLKALEDETGFLIFETALRAGAPEIVGLVGRKESVYSLIAPPQEGRRIRQSEERAKFAENSAGSSRMRDETLKYLTCAFSELVKIPVSRIQPTDPLEKFGVDSIMVLEFTQKLEGDFGDLSKTLLFEHRNLSELAGYFLSSHAVRLEELFSAGGSEVMRGASEQSIPPPQRPPSASEEKLTRVSIPTEVASNDVAIIGVFGRYPMADDLDQFWENLLNGKDCIVEIPPERWDYRLFYDPEPGKPGKTRNKWGGFLNHVDRFDAQFFNITPREAFALDPQERLFLETAWRTVEDAGYRKSALASKKVGVFVGVMYGEYQLHGAGNVETGSVFPLSSSYASIANRVSYVFDWRGPSMAIDTMCSSSLTAIHLACESLRRGESELALAGGVNATLHPHKDMLLSPGGFAASDGRCRSFGEGGDGYVPGEGVGAVLLKPLAQAIADGDHVHAIVKASSLNHGGKTNGYTVPNPKAQAELILEALTLGQVNPQTINYVEAHGTGTALGDPIEIAGMTRAFREAAVSSLESHSCAVGSVKSNIGHLESAAGIAGVTKVLLQMKHGQIVRSLHSATPNPNISFAESIFYVPQTVETWKPQASCNNRPVRRAGVSSFGAGGANAHVLIDEFVGGDSQAPDVSPSLGPALFILSAGSEDRLRARAEQLASYLSRANPCEASPRDIAYTLQIGREPLEERLAFVANDLAEAGTNLARFLSGDASEGLYRGSAREGAERLQPLLDGDEGEAFLEAIIRQRKWSKLARFWVSGGHVEWERLYESVVVKRIALPTYPFAGERYWAPEKLKTLAKQSTAPQLPTQIDRAENKPIGAKPQNHEPAESPELVFLRPTWQERAIAEHTLPSLANLLLFDCDAGLQADIESKYPGWSVTRVVPGAEYAAGHGLITINPRSDEDFRRLVATTKPSLVIHRWIGASGGFDEGLQLGVFALFHLCQALIDPPLRSTLRVLVCDNENPDPARTAVAGFARALAQEQPQIQLRIVQSNRVDARLLSELFAHEGEWQIRWRDGTREVHLLEPFEPQNLDPVPLRARGVYLITGGLGGLGQIFATHLAKEFKARLVLTGRSVLTDESRSAIVELERLGAEVQYVQSDVGSAEDVDKLVRSANEWFGGLNGIVHAAGVLRDAFLLKKSFSAFADVLRAKVHGVALLDEATKEEQLDFFALFSSTAGVFGNAGQIDYSYANAFLDAFASAREKRRRAGERHGKAFSINWPLWKETGMSVRSVHIEERLKQIGLYPLFKDVGLSIFAAALGAAESQIVPLFGIRQTINRSLLGGRETAETIESKAALQINEASLLERTEIYLKGLLAEVTQVPLARLDSHQRFEEFGVDSIVVSDFNLRIEKDLGPLPKTLLFEHVNFRQLNRHLVEAFGPRLARFFANDSTIEPVNLDQPAKESQRERDRKSLTVDRPSSSSAAPQEIAIIGLAGRYPKANDIRAFWDVLRAGTDCITEIPKHRWDINRFFDPDPEKAAAGKMYARWGAFLDDVDKFDPLFFNIAPLEAELMDPQERLFLETAWTVLEDAGYTRRDLARWVRREYATNVGVFVGVTSNSYAAVARDSGHGRAVPTTLPWSLANRVSYLFNFNGPSIPVDTACSSSLTAIHLACEAIRRGECQQAIAGGVNLYLHPSRYVSLCLTRMLSTDGKCRAFGEGGSGFVPGEGVGAVFLKPLSLALADRDHIYGVIKGSAVNHGGRTNGYTVPNPVAQSDLIKRALREANVEPRTLTYLEAHGTGTSLGDPIELAGLTKAFTEAGDEPPVAGLCALGSVKTNIGHLESAAGIAGLTKVLLQFKAGELVPSLHCEAVNPNITLEGTPFRLQRRLEPWSPLVINDETWPRRAGISSFGAGGANAHLVVEEFVSPVHRQNTANEASVLIVLSARCEESLRQFAASLARFSRRSIEGETPIQSIAYTLQVGRESFEERIGFVVGDRDELIAKLDQIATGDLAGAIHGRVRRERIQVSAEADEPEPDSAITSALQQGDLEELAKLWVGGAAIDWRVLWGERLPVRRISLPGYTFRRGRYWIEVATEHKPTGEGQKPKLHPLVERSESKPNGCVYRSRLASNEIVLRDHQIGNNNVLPGAASLELAMFAATQVLADSNVRLRNVVWLRPLIAKPDGLNIALHLVWDGADRCAFALKDADDQLAMQGKAERIDSFDSERQDLEEIRARCTASISPEQIYRAFANRQLRYGPGFQVLQDIRCGQGEVLAELQVPLGWTDGTYRLHPVLIDGALQSLAVLGSRGEGVELPFALESLQCRNALPQHCYAYCQVQGEEDVVRRFEIRLLNENGEVLAQLAGLSMRRSESQRDEIVLCRPVWSPEPIERQPGKFGKILLFDEEADLVSRIQGQGISVVRVVPADQFARDGTVIRIRRGHQEDYERVCQEVEFDAIVHAWSARGIAPEESVERGPLSVHRLAKALIKSGKVVPWLYIYPQGEPVYEAVAGYAKSLQQEQPMLHLKTVGTTDCNPDLVAELNDSRFEVRYHNGLREVRGLDECVIPSLPLEPGLKQGSVYLVTGGAGGLGRIFSDHLLRNFDARLVLVGRSELPRDRQEKLGSSTIYVRADVSTVEGATRAISEAKRQFGALHGIIHAAGELRDGLIRTKSEEDFSRVLGSKVRGAETIDQVTCDEALDCFILFSSTAALLGNAGQADYAYANAYLDAFTRRREELRLNGQRSGRTLSINWPLWREGGMRASEAALRFQAEIAGLRPLETAEGLSAFDQIVSMREAQCAVLCGSPRRLLSRLDAKADPNKSKASPSAARLDARVPKTELLDKLKDLVGKVLRLDPKVIESDADTSEYGFDSVTFTTLANELNAELGLEITPAVLFEYTTLETFAEFLCRKYSAEVTARIGLVTQPTIQEPAQSQAPVSQRKPEPVRENRNEIPRSLGDIAASEVRGVPKLTLQPIAVVGMSGIFPGSPNLNVFWQNLETGADLISKPALERWSFPAVRSEVNGAEEPIELPWGGFMPGVDQFDSLFFDISPREAELMDPQQRLFLQTVWHTLEDAGYRKSDLAGTKTGLFVGVAANDYANLLAMAGVPIEAYSSTGNAHSVLANRVSFYFDWHGPSEAIDTACSSSLVAVHRAIESMASGSCDLALVGGVNVLLSPGAFLAFGKAGMLCEDGRCKAFDSRANGYVRGEGVGAILLKPLDQALQDHDHIYGVIRGSAENHGGRARGLTVPNPNAQAELLQDAYTRAGIDPFTIGYIEAHGTGTSLGDPIEVNGLKKAFGHNRGDIPESRCAVGSVKTNIGHLETAAGIAGIIKALLAMRHRRIPGNVHLAQLNPYIQIDGTPFYFPEKTVSWEPAVDRANRVLPRRAGVSSFGFGGANAHILLEEFPREMDRSDRSEDSERPELFLFTARSSETLTELIGEFIQYLRLLKSEKTGLPKPSLRQIAFTLQTGREPLNERLAIIASDIDRLIFDLERFEQSDRADAFTGNINDTKTSLRLLREVHQDDQFLEPLIEGRELAKLARLWIGGLNVAWEKLWTGEEVMRVSLPGYPFEQHRFWIPKVVSGDGFDLSRTTGYRLHPLLHRNESTLKAQVYQSEFTGEEVFFRDHRVAGQKVFPGAASLELALVGASLALESVSVALRQVVWLRPVVIGSKTVNVRLQLHPETIGPIRFELRNPEAEVHVSGKAESTEPFLREELDLVAIRSRCEQEVSTAELYRTFAERGLEYGVGFRVIRQIQRGRAEVLSTLEVPAAWGHESFRLHPALVDGAFQSLAVIGGSIDRGVELPFGVEEVICPQPLPQRCLAFVRLSPSDNGEQRYDIKLLNEEGQVLASILGLSLRRAQTGKAEPFFFTPRWSQSESVATNGTSMKGPLLLFDDQTELANTLSQKEVATVRVICGDCYQRSEDTVTIRREDGADYARLVQETEFARVIHRWSRPTPTMDEALASGVSSVHLLVQALLKAKKRRPIAFLYPVGIPAFEAVGGYAKTLLQEQPDLQLKTIGIDSESVDLLPELENAELEVRYLAGRREVRSLETASVSNADQPALRRGAVYLISGGAGGLGRIFARYLIERYDARVVLAGRSSLDEPVLRDLGRNAAYVSADISTWEGAQKAVDYVKNCYGTINSVVHAAGVLRDGLIWSKTSADFGAVLGPKVRGAEALDAATVQERLDCFIVFSSMAGLLGNAGQSDYAYANAYLDAFAHRREELRRNGERSGRTLSINWPLWRGGGMSGNFETDRAAALGLQLLEPNQGLQLFEYALASELVQVWTGVGDREKIRTRLLAGRVEPQSCQSTARARGEEPKPGTSKTELIAYLTRVFATVMRLEERQVKPAESLESYGFDSILAVEFSQLLAKDFGELSQTLLFEYPTIESLAAYLIERTSNQRERLIERRDQAISTNGISIARLGGTAELRRRLELAPTDYLFVDPRRLAIQVLYYFENRLDFQRLKTGLERVAKEFYPINSKLVPDGDREYVIAESSDTPDFAEIVCGEAVSLPQQDEPATFESFRVAFNPLLASEKLAKFRLIQLERGSLLSVNVSHAIADGYSYYYFLSAWAAASRSEPFQVPDHSRAILARLAKIYQEKQGDKISASEAEMNLTPVDPSFDPTTQRIETLHIDPESLLAEARKGADAETRVRLTENGVLAALVWQTYARSLPEDSGELTLACPIDFRRIIPELSPAFFGNASAPALIRLSNEAVRNASIGQLAVRISDEIRRCDATTFIRYSAMIDKLRTQRGLAAVDRMGLVDPRNGLIVTNVARFPLPPIDFGAGIFSREYTPTNYAGTGVIVSEGPRIKVRLAYPDLVVS